MNATDIIRVITDDDHEIVRSGITFSLQVFRDLELVGEAQNGEEAVNMALELKPDVILMDVNMPDFSGVEATQRIRSVQPDINVLILTISKKDKDLIEAVKAGAKGYLLKSSESSQVMDAIRRVAAGEAILPPDLVARVLDELTNPTPTPQILTARELEILKPIKKHFFHLTFKSSLYQAHSKSKEPVKFNDKMLCFEDYAVV